MFELVKYLACVELINIDNGVSIFQRKPPGPSIGSLTIDASSEILRNQTDL